MSRYRVAYARRFRKYDIDESPAAHAARAALQHRVTRGAASALAGPLLAPA
jgi:hypothetical protein